MSSRRSVIGSILFAFCLGAHSGHTLGANVGEAQVLPPPAGMARVWFLRQFAPSESPAIPMIFANSAPLALMHPGTAFFHDFQPGTYIFSPESYGVDVNQTQTLQLAPGMQIYLEVQPLTSWTTGCNYARDTFYVRPVSLEWAHKYLLPLLTYIGSS